MEETKFCSNCEENIPESKFILHERFCASNVKKCQICKEIINIEDEQEHINEFHTQVECLHCKKGFNKDKIESHQANCDEQLDKCQYCELDIAKKEKKTHEYTCGAKTEKCNKCNEFVQMKDYNKHISMGCKSKEAKKEIVPPKVVNRPKDSNRDRDRDKERQLEKEKEKEIQMEIERQIEIEKQIEKEKQIEREREKQKIKERERDIEKQKIKEREREREIEKQIQSIKSNDNNKKPIQFNNNNNNNEVDWSIYTNEHEKQLPIATNPKPSIINKAIDNKKGKINQPLVSKPANSNQIQDKQGQLVEKTKQILDQSKHKPTEHIEQQYSNNKQYIKSDQKQGKPTGSNDQISNNNSNSNYHKNKKEVNAPSKQLPHHSNLNVKYPDDIDNKRIEKHNKIISKYQGKQSDQKDYEYKKQIPVKEDKREMNKPKPGYDVNPNPIHNYPSNSNNQKVAKPLPKENPKQMQASKSNPSSKPNQQSDYHNKYLDDYLPDDVLDFNTKDNFYHHVENPTDEDIDLNKAIQESLKSK